MPVTSIMLLSSLLNVTFTRVRSFSAAAISEPCFQSLATCYITRNQQKILTMTVQQIVIASQFTEYYMSKNATLRWFYTPYQNIACFFVVVVLFCCCCCCFFAFVFCFLFFVFCFLFLFFFSFSSISKSSTPFRKKNASYSILFKKLKTSTRIYKRFRE